MSKGFKKRQQRVRYNLKRKAGPNTVRFSVHKSNGHIYAQLIDDSKGETLAAASTLQKAIKNGLKSTSSIEAAKKVGQQIARIAVEKLSETQRKVVYDRGGNSYHGKIKALAEAARENGLIF